MTARSAYTQLQNITRDLQRTTLPKLPPAFGFEGDEEFGHQLDLWQQWIRFEIDDNLVLKEEDIGAYRKRVLFVFRQALMALQFWPQLWYDAADFCFAHDMEDEGMKFLMSGATSNSESCLLAFRISERIELSTTNDETSDPGAKDRFAKVRAPMDKSLDALYELITKAKNREIIDIKAVQDEYDTEVAQIMQEDEDDINTTEKEQRKASFEAQMSAIKQNVTMQTELLGRTISFVWVAIIRAARRVQGKGRPGEKMGGFRTVFGEARKRGRINSHVYAETALMEYHCYQDPLGTKIFDRGAKLFPEDEQFLMAYLKHLVAINDITSKSMNISSTCCC